MYDKERMNYEERSFSWTDLFIKVIVTLIIILIAIWLLSLPNKGISKSLDVIKGNIFSENINKVKEAGKEYFTTERLPKEVGDVEKITLEKMYNEKMLLTLTDEKGNACSAKNSYVSVEKLDDEYKMTVYLECDSKSDYIIVTMGCYNYCDKDQICEKDKTEDKPEEKPDEPEEPDEPEDKPVENKKVEYQYSKSTGGHYGSWGNYSDWSKNAVSKNDSRDVQTKDVLEEYSYNRHVSENKFMSNATCEKISGYTLVSNQNNICSYVRNETALSEPICRTVSGYTYVGRNNFTCNYTQNVNNYADPICLEMTGYTYVGRNGFNCRYSTTKTSDTEYTLSYYSTGSGTYVPKDTSTYHYVQTSADYVYKCDGSCGAKWYYTYTIYKKVYKTIPVYIDKDAKCPTGYKENGTNCLRVTTSNITRIAECPTGYVENGTNCKKTSVTNITRDAICPSDQTISNSKCYKWVNYTVKETGTRTVTYYRFRTRTYIDGTTDYKWSYSNNDSQLLNSGYKLTGVTRVSETGGK